MAGLLLGDAVGAVEIAADIARRNAEAARRRDEDMGEVLADAALEREGFAPPWWRHGSDRCRTPCLRLSAVEQGVQQRETCRRAFGL